MAGADGVNNSGQLPELPDLLNNVDFQRTTPTEGRNEGLPASYAFRGLLPRKSRLLSGGDATEFGLNATSAPLPAGADKVTHKTLAAPLNPLTFLSGSPFLAVFVGKTKQVAHFPPTSEHPNGSVAERSISFIEFPEYRIKGRVVASGSKFKLGEHTRIRDLSDPHGKT